MLQILFANDCDLMYYMSVRLTDMKYCTAVFSESFIDDATIGNENKDSNSPFILIFPNYKSLFEIDDSLTAFFEIHKKFNFLELQ